MDITFPSQKPLERSNPIPILQKGKVTQKDELMGLESQIRNGRAGNPRVWTPAVPREPGRERQDTEEQLKGWVSLMVVQVGPVQRPQQRGPVGDEIQPVF